MDTYRLFILDAEDNLVSGVDLRSESDDEALDWSSVVVRPDSVGELWCGSRCVGRIEHAYAAPRATATIGLPCKPAETGSGAWQRAAAGHPCLLSASAA
jgi:hypothetical protein